MSDERLPVPVRRVLDDTVDDAKLGRLWQSLAAARERRVVPVKRAIVIACAAVFAAAAVVLLLRPPAAAALHLADGRDVPANMARGRPGRVSFDDGSFIDVGPEGALDLLESTARSFAMAIRSGTIDVDVTPGGPRIWRIECGSVTVEVVGTRFRIERTPQYVRVSVSRGAVLVRGDDVPDHVVRLGPGQAIVVQLGARSARTPAAEAPPNAAATTNQVDTSYTSSQSLNDPLPATRGDSIRHEGATPAISGAPVVASAGATAAFASAAVPAASAGPVATSIADGLAAADAFRREGRFAEAASMLERAIAEHETDPSAPLAEFSLGRLYLDSLNDAARAQVHFARALARGVPSAIAEDVQARLVEASARAGNLDAARQAATLYRSRYPNGRHVADVDRWTGGR
jgi:transmembrane sensor